MSHALALLVVLFGTVAARTFRTLPYPHSSPVDDPSVYNWADTRQVDVPKLRQQSIDAYLEGREYTVRYCSVPRQVTVHCGLL